MSSLEISTEFLPDDVLVCGVHVVCIMLVSFFFESPTHTAAVTVMEQKKAKKWSVQWMFFQKHRPEILVI